MSGSKTFAGFLMLAIGAISLIIIYHFAFLSTASSDIGVNLTGTSYQAAYNTSGNTTREAFAAFGYVPPIVGVIALIFAVMLLMAVVLSRRR